MLPTWQLPGEMGGQTYDACLRCRAGTRSTPNISPPGAARGLRLHVDALTLITRLHLLALCRLAVRVARWRGRPPAGVSGDLLLLY